MDDQTKNCNYPHAKCRTSFYGENTIAAPEHCADRTLLAFWSITVDWMSQDMEMLIFIIRIYTKTVCSGLSGVRMSLWCLFKYPPPPLQNAVLQIDDYRYMHKRDALRACNA